MKTDRLGQICVFQAIISLLLTICGSSTVFAQPNGSPSSLLERGQWVLGLEGDGMFKRSMKGGTKVSVYQGGHYRGYGLTDWLSVYGTIAGAYVDVNDSSITKSFGANMLVDAQLKARLWTNRRKDLELDGDLQYIFIGAPHRRKGNQVNWNEWQVGTSVAKAFGRVKPYAGVKVSWFAFDYTVRQSGTQRNGTYKPDGLVSPFIGMDLTVGERKDTVINIEGSFVTGTEITAAVMKRF